MLIFLFFLAAGYGYFTGMPARDIVAMTGLWLIAYFAIRILANLLFDADAEMAHKINERNHMRSGFRGISYDSKTGKYEVLHNGDNRDHAQRCQDSLRDWYKIEQRLKWNNWIYSGVIIAIFLFLDRIMK